jgi:hypothetical protein
MTRTQQLIAGAVALVLALGGLAFVLTRGGDDEVATTSSTSAPTTTEAPATTTTTAPGPVYALTGLPVDDPAMAARPTLIVKIDNVDYAARPQAGLNEADIVYEEQVEGGVTRFAAVFQSHNAEVGPVRSARTTDIAIGTQFGRPLFAFSGANTIFMDLIRASPLIELSYDWNPQLYTRVPDRPAPDNIFTPTETIYAADTGEATPPPDDVFVFRAAGADLPATAIDASGVTYTFGGSGVPVTFTWDPELKGWRRDQNGTPHVDKAGADIAPENLIIQNVNYVDSGARDVAGNPVPEAQLVGEGDVLVFTRGKAIPGRWSRAGADDVTTFTDTEGDPIALTPGQTWISLLPPGIAELHP